MTGLVLAILFGLICLLFPSEGQVSLPPEGNTFVVLPGENVTIAWKLDVNVSEITGRSWKFLPKGSDTFAHIVGDGGVVEKPQYSPGLFTITKPSTLILNNVNIQYNGTYRFFASTLSMSEASEVTVFVAEQPNVTINCPSHITLDEGDDFTCVCRSKGGNPPGNLTWYKDGEQIRITRYGENRFTRTNVNKDDNGIYTCKAQSYTLEDVQSIEVKVRLNFKPNNTKLTPNTAVVGISVVITCKSEGLPEPKYTITRNGTVVSTNKTYTISEVMGSDAGTCTYICIASNKLGNDSACSNLTIEPSTPTPSPPTPSPTPTPTTTTTSSSTSQVMMTPTKNGADKSKKTGLIVGIIAGVVGLAIIVGIVAYCYKSKEKDGYRGNADVSPGASGGLAENQYELDGEPSGGVDNTYDAVNNPGATGTKSKPPENTTPDVYAAVDKKNREGKPLYATLDSLALEQADNSKKKRDEERAGQTEYASIDFAKIGKAGQE